MTEQQNHLQVILQQRQQLIAECNVLNEQLAAKRDMIIKYNGAIEYLQEIGVTLPEPEVEEVEGEEGSSEEE